MAREKDIAIVGMSCYFPGASNLQEFWMNLANGVSSITEAPENRVDPRYFYDGKNIDIDHFYFRKGGFVSPIKIDPIQFGILPIAAEGIDPDHLVALHLVEEALTDAGVFEKKIPLQKCCFILGKGNYFNTATFRIADFFYGTILLEMIARSICPDLQEEEIERIKKEYHSQLGRYQADTAAGSMPNLVVSLAANWFDMKGPAYTIDAACASSMLAVEQASNLLLSGQCDLALAGGMHLGQGPTFWSVFNLIGAASHKNQISPFSEDADGMLVGEGAGIVVLKKLDKAVKDKDRIYAVIKACSSTSDGSDVSVMAPSSKGQIAALKLAWEKAQMDPQKIGYVETHGTATQVGDKVEITTLTEFFGDNTAPQALLGSVKSNIGHPMAASGVAGLIKTALALYHKKIPPTLHCEKPMKAMYNSRFLPSQKLTDWDESKYPLVAAVNTFGFGGVNSHVILEPYSDPEPTTMSNTKTELLKDNVISLSAQNKEELLSKLERKDYTVSGGNYRLVVFNPSADKLEKTKSLIEKDKPWKGRLDIWFSNEPLLVNDAKVVCMFTGFDAGTEIETQTIVDYFGIPYKQVEIGKDPLMGHSINHFYRCQLLDQALKDLGLTPDINIGHSLGEWHAAGASGFVTPDSIERLIELYNPETYMITDALYVAVGSGYEKIKSWCEKIPDLYLANDNCSNQILMAGKEKSVQLFTEQLKKEKIFYQVLPFQSGYHTPLFPEEALTDFYNLYRTILEYQEGNIPLWSSTIIDEYPKNKEDFYGLFARSLKETVRFRELIGKLYEQVIARVFIQIGVGPLTGFVEDILKGKSAGIISTVHPSRSGIEQIRRIVALLFIEGKTVNKELIGIKETNNAKQSKFAMPLDFTFKTIREFPTLQALVNKRMQKVNTSSSTIPAFSSGDIINPVLQEANANLQKIAALQENMIQWFQSNRNEQNSKKEQIENQPASMDKTHPQRTGKKIERIIRFDLNDHLYLLDHMMVHQPKNRPLEELNPVVPLSMTIESLCEHTLELVPEKKVVKISSAGVLKWIQVKKPFVEKMTGQWKTDDSISWMLHGYAYGDITIGDYPAVPKEYTKTIDLGKNIIPKMPETKQIYSYFMFHGPRYQTIINVTEFTKTGIRAYARKAEGKGSLLDTLGQLIGLYCHLHLEKGQTTFPMNVDEILFYQDFNDQEGIFEFTVFDLEIKDQEAVGNIVIKRDGIVWAIVHGWHSRRLNYHPKGMKAVIHPKRFLLADILNRNVFFYYYESQLNATFLDFLYERYLNLKEREHYHSLYLNQARNYLISRVVLKDGVRKFIQKEEEDDFIFPIEISVQYNEHGKPYLYGNKEVNGLEVSIAHKGSEAVVIVSEKPVGIDIEKIEPRNQEFMNIAFTPHELDLLKEKENEMEWVARFWVAKEAYGKMLGLGLGNPKHYEIEAVSGEDLQIKNTTIKTSIHRKDFIIGWTE